MGLVDGLKEKCTVTVRDINGELAGIGCSAHGDLFTDNFGYWLAGLFRTPATTSHTVMLTDSTNTGQTAIDYQTGGNVFNDAISPGVGTSIQIGSSVTAPARSDYKIGTAFSDAPESGFNGTTTGSYAAGSGNITFATSMTANAAESGTINEAGLFGTWNSGAGTIVNFMLIHDAIVPGVAFLGGQSITVSWSITD